MYNRIKQMNFIARKILKFYESCEVEKVGSDILGVITMDSYFVNMKTVMFPVKKIWSDPIGNTSTVSTSFSPTCTKKKFEVIKKFADSYQDINTNVEKYNKNGFHMITELVTAYRYSREFSIYIHDNQETYDYLIHELKIDVQAEFESPREGRPSELYTYLSEYHGRNRFLLACISGRNEIVVSQ